MIGAVKSGKMGFAGGVSTVGEEEKWPFSRLDEDEEWSPKAKAQPQGLLAGTRRFR